MKKNWRKIVIPLLVIAVIVMGSLTAWSIYKEKGNSRTADIPKDGVVSASAFKKIKNTHDMKMFNGEENGIKYQWLFLGNDITKPRDINLLISFNNDELDSVKSLTSSEWVQGFSFNESDSIDYNPTISIELNSKWDCSGADIYKFDEKTNTYVIVSGASVENSDRTIVTFIHLDNKGKFYIVGNGTNQYMASNKEENKDEENKKEEEEKKSEAPQYLTDSKSSGSGNKPYTNKSKEKYASTARERAQMARGSDKKDKYQTDPTPEGKPSPVEWQDKSVDKSKVRYCTLSIRCDTLLKPANYAEAKSNGKEEMIPSNGIIYATRTVEFYEGEFVFDVLLREVKKNKIHMEFEMTPIFNSNYIQGINNLYEFDGGALSGWMYKVNGWFPNYGCSRYLLKDGDVIEWVYTCDLGRDVGCEWMGGQ
ncbi:DUF4430 domain-containing protein [Clostridium simiarum]